MLKPLIPVVTNWYSHEFNETEHLLKVHAVYGSHHVEKEIASNNNSSDHSKAPGILKSEDQVSFHLSIHPFKCGFFANKIESRFCLRAEDKLSFLSATNQGPPPKFS